MDKLEKIPQIEIQNAKEKCKRVTSEIDLIDELAKLALDAQDELKERIEESLKTESNPNGILTKPKERYDACMKMDRDGIRSIC